ncbi:hypothetical protein MMC34_008396 [Xylographa carneopallida]|nr:hypothetical protein [Xylographa carneopallida]
MPIGIERINARRPQPNSRIVFIKPLPGPTAAFAQDFLERVAAICHPIMKANHLSVMSLEEYEPNPEFIGRNFNAGEIIQLVLKTPYSGHWMSFRSVVMVMMHELAHCIQMNHSGAFWKVRNGYAAEMKELWAKGYTGDGLWGRGKTLLSGEYEGRGEFEAGEMPRSLCGGTYRTSRRRKRKRKGGAVEEQKPLTYAERQQRRISKKFGTNGITLGDDKGTRVKLEDGKKPKGKPRVAKSARGRELRAAAALARLDRQQEEFKAENDECDSTSDTESDYDDATVKAQDAVDRNGLKMLDGKGHGMIKVCEEEDFDDVHVKEEMQELRDINDIAAISEETKSPTDIVHKQVLSHKHTDKQKSSKGVATPSAQKRLTLQTTSPTDTIQPEGSSIGRTCPVCSMSNDFSSLLCIACSHVLDVCKMPRHWKCSSEACAGSLYVNSEDYGLCGVCGTRKPD